MKTKLFLILLFAALIMAVPAMAQQITGTPGSPDATTTIGGKQLPAPDPKFGGVIKERSPEVESVVGAAHRAPQTGPQHPAHYHG